MKGAPIRGSYALVAASSSVFIVSSRCQRLLYPILPPVEITIYSVSSSLYSRHEKKLTNHPTWPFQYCCAPLSVCPRQCTFVLPFQYCCAPISVCPRPCTFVLPLMCTPTDTFSSSHCPVFFLCSSYHVAEGESCVSILRPPGYALRGASPQARDGGPPHSRNADVLLPDEGLVSLVITLFFKYFKVSPDAAPIQKRYTSDDLLSRSFRSCRGTHRHLPVSPGLV